MSHPGTWMGSSWMRSLAGGVRGTARPQSRSERWTAMADPWTNSGARLCLTGCVLPATLQTRTLGPRNKSLGTMQNIASNKRRCREKQRCTEWYKYRSAHTTLPCCMALNFLDIFPFKAHPFFHNEHNNLGSALASSIAWFSFLLKWSATFLTACHQRDRISRENWISGSFLLCDI